MAYDWIQLFPAHLPGNHSYDPMIYDEARQELMVMGAYTDGTDQNTVTLTWVWNGSDWTQRSPAHVITGPFGNILGGKSPSMAYDRVNQKAVVFGGTDGTTSGSPFFFGLGTQKTWLWDGVDWSNPSPTHKPSARLEANLAWSGVDNKVLLFGGQPNTGGLTTYTDTWLWDGTDWTQVFPAHNADRPGRMCPYFNNVLLITGPETWIWDGSDWTNVGGTQPSPGRGIVAGLDFDTTRGLAVCFGGTGLHGSNDTWVFDGSNWTQEFPVHQPPNRIAPSMAYDAQTGLITMMGGFTNNPGGGLQDTWVYKLVSGILHLEGVQHFHLNP